MFVGGVEPRLPNAQELVAPLGSALEVVTSKQYDAQCLLRSAIYRPKLQVSRGSGLLLKTFKSQSPPG